MICTLILVKYFLNFCCGSKVSFGYQVLWVLVEIVVVQVLATVNWHNYDLNIAALLLCLGSTVTLYARVLLFAQLKLAAYGMTLKEIVARRQSSQAEFEKDAREAISCGDKTSNLATFFCCRSRLNHAYIH